MLRGKLQGYNRGNNVLLRFMQRGNCEENRNVPIKIYRREAPEINFTNDISGMAFNKWFEYLDNQSHLDSRVRVIFEGILPLEHSYNEYCDRTVDIGKIYIYWVEADSCGEHTVLGPTGIKVRSRDVWWPNNKTVQKMEQLQREFPQLIKLETYGETTLHEPIRGIRIGNQKKNIAIVGAIHASETGPEQILKAITYMLKEDVSLFEKVGASILPTLNIDVREESVNGYPYYLRLNHNGVDLNRNFDDDWKEQFVYGIPNTIPQAPTYHGPYPNSENETKAAISFLRSCSPCALFVFDGGSVITEDWLLYAGNPEDGELYKKTTEIANLYSQTFRADHPGCGTFTAPPISYPREEAIFSATGSPTGTLDGWAYHKLSIPSYSLQYAKSEEAKMRLNDDTTLDILERWSIRHAYALKAVFERFSNE